MPQICTTSTRLAVIIIIFIVFFLYFYIRYGDRSPRSLLARIYAAVWMIIGMVTLSTFTADVSSVLTAREMLPRSTHLNKTVIY